ncbi:hypothetical protein ACW5EG_02085 [Luteimonas sp. A611]
MTDEDIPAGNPDAGGGLGEEPPADRLIDWMDLRARQEAAFAVLDGVLLRWWVSHEDGCPASEGGSCCCDLVVWFSMADRVLGVDSSLAVYEFLVH